MQEPGESALAGWTVYLDLNNDGTLDPGDPTAVTNANGNLSLHRGCRDLHGPAVGTGSLDANHHRTRLDHPRQRRQRDRDQLRRRAAQISGRVFQDSDDNGKLDAADPSLSGWTVLLDADNNGTPGPDEASTTTDAYGDYRFSNLAAGTYIVREVVPAGWVQSTTNPAPATVGNGTVASGVNFGDYQPIAISGQVFQDVNGDALHDPDARGLSGWTVYLDLNHDGTLDPGDPTAVTDANGDYAFTGLRPAPSPSAKRYPAAGCRPLPTRRRSRCPAGAARRA